MERTSVTAMRMYAALLAPVQEAASPENAVPIADGGNTGKRTSPRRKIPKSATPPLRDAVGLAHVGRSDMMIPRVRCFPFASMARAARAHASF